MCPKEIIHYSIYYAQTNYCLDIESAHSTCRETSTPMSFILSETLSVLSTKGKPVCMEILNGLMGFAGRSRSVISETPFLAVFPAAFDVAAPVTEFIVAQTVVLEE